ncbi:MAG: EndoU domain-containing protein [Clostridium sp.]|nr:EndoU domain-containing protein [Clostridium sp.]
MSPQQVVDAINEAYSNCELKLGTRNTYQGVAKNGMKIDMFLDENHKIISAFPKE